MKGVNTMAKTDRVNVRVEPELKNAAEQLFRRYGLTMTQAITLFLFTSLRNDRLPFALDEDTAPVESDSNRASVLTEMQNNTK